MPFGSTRVCKGAPRRRSRVGARFFRIDAFRATRDAQISSSKIFGSNWVVLVRVLVKSAARWALISNSRGALAPTGAAGT